MGARENKKTVAEFIEAMARSDRRELERLLGADAIWTNVNVALAPEPHRGRKAILDEFLLPAQRRLRDLSIEVVGMIGEGDYVATEVVTRAKTLAGVAYSNPYHILFRVSAGKVREIRNYFDTLHAKETLFASERN